MAKKTKSIYRFVFFGKTGEIRVIAEKLSKEPSLWHFLM